MDTSSATLRSTPSDLTKAHQPRKPSVIDLTNDFEEAPGKSLEQSTPPETILRQPRKPSVIDLTDDFEEAPGKSLEQSTPPETILDQAYVRTIIYYLT
jgi:hypothetical protein